MDRRIPIALESTREIAIDGDTVARALGLEVAAFRKLMDERKIAVLCERGTDEDEGLYRATFYHGPHRARLVVDASGNIIAPVAIDHG